MRDTPLINLLEVPERSDIRTAKDAIEAMRKNSLEAAELQKKAEASQSSQGLVRPILASNCALGIL